MSDDDQLRGLHDADHPAAVPDLSELRQRFTEFLETAADSGSPDDDNPDGSGPDGGDPSGPGGGGSPRNPDAPRTSDPGEGIHPSETSEDAGPQLSEGGPAMTDNHDDTPNADQSDQSSDTFGPDLADEAVVDEGLGFQGRADANVTDDLDVDVEFSADEVFGFFDYDDGPGPNLEQVGIGDLGREPASPAEPASPTDGAVDLPEGTYRAWVPSDEGSSEPPNWNTPGHGIDQGYRPFPTIIPRIPAIASQFGDIVEFEGTEYFWDGDTWNEVGSRPLIGELSRHGDVTIHNGEPWTFLDGRWFKEHTETPQPSPRHYWDTTEQTWVIHDGVDSPPHQPGTVADQNGPNRWVWSDGGPKVTPPWVSSPERPALLELDPDLTEELGAPVDDGFDAFADDVLNPTTRQGAVEFVEYEISDAGDPPELDPLLDYIEECGDEAFAEGLWHFYDTHEFPVALHDAVQWMQARRGRNPRNFAREVEEAQRRLDEDWERQRPRRTVLVEVAMDIDAAGSDESLEDLRAYVSIVDEAEFEKGLDHFYEHHDFPESLHDAVQRMQAHRGAFPRRFDDDPVENREVPPQRVAIQRATVADPDPIVLDEPTSGLEKTARRRLLGPVIGIVIVALIGVGFLLTRGGDDSEPAPGDGGDAPALATDTTVPADENPPADDQPEDDPVDSAAPAQPDPTDVQPPATAEVTAPPAATGELPQPLFIVLSDESQYPVWGLENPDGTVTYVMSSPARADGCLLISHGGNDVDTWGDCNLRQIGTSQPATVLYMGEDGSVLLHLRDPNVVNLTDEVGFAQSAIVDVLDAPVIDRQDVLTAFGTTYRSVE